MHVVARILIVAVLQVIATYFYFKKRTAIYLVIAVFLFAGWFLQIQSVDDMFIPLRYARNWATGLGPVFNPGERVEGYTCFLWVTLLAILNRLSLDPLIAAKFLSIVSSLISLFVLHQVCLRKDVSDFNRTAAVCLLAFNLPFLYWTFVGMEAAFSALLNLLMVLSFLKWTDQKQDSFLVTAFVLSAFAAMTRPEAIVLFGLMWLWCIVFSERKFRDLLIAGTSFTLVFGSFLLWRYSYYGYFLPNTYYAKVGTFGVSLLVRGIKYALLFLIPNFLLLIPALRPGFAVVGRKSQAQSRPGFAVAGRESPASNLCIASLALTYCLSVALEGGDHYSASRLFVPIIPLLALLWCESQIVFPRISRSVAVGLMVLVTFLTGFFFRGHQAFETAAGGARARSIAVWLTKHVPSNTLIATMSVGVVPYYSNLPTQDLLGLVDAHISHSGVPQKRGKSGHEKFDNDYVMKRKPGVFLFAKCYKDEATLMKEAKAIVPMYDDLLTRFFPNPDYVFVKVVREKKYCSTLLVRKDLTRNWQLDKTGTFLALRSADF